MADTWELPPPPGPPAERPPHLDTFPQVFFSLCMGTLCRAERTACREEMFLKARHSLATSIHRSRTLALPRAVTFGSPRQDVMTHFTTLLNCTTVAQTVGATFSCPGRFLLPQVEPRHSEGSTFLNTSWGGGGVSLSPATAQLSVQAGVTGLRRGSGS